MPDNLTFTEALIVILVTAVLTHWLPGLFGALNNWWMRNIRRVEVQAEANLDNSGADKNRADAMGTLLDTVERLTTMVNAEQEARLADRSKYLNEVAVRDEEILQLRQQLRDVTGRLLQLETVRTELDAARAKIKQADIDFETEHEIRTRIQEEYLVAKDRWRLERQSLEEQIAGLRREIDALKENMRRLENLQKSTIEIQAIKDESNERSPYSPLNSTAEPAAES